VFSNAPVPTLQELLEMDVARPGPRLGVVPATLTTSAPTLLPLRVPELPPGFTIAGF
jgi:hypothetical protein